MLQTRCKIRYEYSVEIKNHNLYLTPQIISETLQTTDQQHPLSKPSALTLGARGVNIHKTNSSNNFKSLLEMTSTTAPEKERWI